MNFVNFPNSEIVRKQKRKEGQHLTERKQTSDI